MKNERTKAHSYKANKVKSLIKQSIACGVILNMLLGSVAHAEVLSTYDQNRMLGATAIDWQSSNLREWLNSDKAVVDYTALKPSYQSETGFLSDNNFSQAERDAIAVTKHGAGWQVTFSGNMNNTLHYSQRSVAHNDYKYNDKVFILHYTELMNYIERNKVLMDSNKKYYSNYLQRVTNKTNKYDYVVNSGYYNTAYTNNSCIYTSTFGATYPRITQNIVPALSLKPDYVLSNGISAKNLNIGSKVTFGKYNGEAIEWQVINKFDNGSPLLWSTKIITTKEYDVQGDINPATSNYINFSTSDVDTTIGNGQAKSWETSTNILSTPVITIQNEADLMTPTNNTSILLKIKATDANYAIRKITLPDGTVVNGDYAEWTLPANGEYDIIAENSIGVIAVRHIITKAINTPAEVTITTDKDSSTKWTNKPVSVTVSATNNGVYTQTLPGNRNMGYGASNTGQFPSWLSLGGKRIRITGTIKNVMTDAEASQVDMNAYLRMRLTMRWYNVNQVGMTYPVVKDIKLADLKAQGTINIDTIYTIQNDSFDTVYGTISLMDSNSVYMKAPYNYWISDFKYEILDKDDLQVVQIALPDGNVVNDDHVTYTISTAGSYTFSALDNRGKITSKTIDLAIDTVNPTIDIVNSQPGFTKETVLNINATDNLSGIKSIKLPNGEYRTTSAEGLPLSVSYNVIANGNYTFEALDYAGNKFSKTITVSNIDTVAPTATITQNPTIWTSSSVILSIIGQDSGSGVKDITLPNGTIVSGGSANYTATTNGTYSFKVTDYVGNSIVKTYTVGNIDTTTPVLTITKPSTWSNSTITITATAVDNESGIKQITLPNGSSVTGSSITFTVSDVGVYYFTAVYNVGNKTTNYIIVDNIDKTKPTVDIGNNQNWNNSSGVAVTITGVD